MPRYHPFILRTDEERLDAQIETMKGHLQTQASGRIVHETHQTLSRVYEDFIHALQLVDQSAEGVNEGDEGDRSRQARVEDAQLLIRYLNLRRGLDPLIADLTGEPRGPAIKAEGSEQDSEGEQDEGNGFGATSEGGDDPSRDRHRLLTSIKRWLEVTTAHQVENFDATFLHFTTALGRVLGKQRLDDEEHERASMDLSARVQEMQHYATQITGAPIVKNLEGMLTVHVPTARGVRKREMTHQEIWNLALLLASGAETLSPPTQAQTGRHHARVPVGGTQPPYHDTIASSVSDRHPQIVAGLPPSSYSFGYASYSAFTNSSHHPGNARGQHHRQITHLPLWLPSGDSFSPEIPYYPDLNPLTSYATPSVNNGDEQHGIYVPLPSPYGSINTGSGTNYSAQGTSDASADAQGRSW